MLIALPPAPNSKLPQYVAAAEIRSVGFLKTEAEPSVAVIQFGMTTVRITFPDDDGAELWCEEVVRRVNAGTNADLITKAVTQTFDAFWNQPVPAQSNAR